MNHGVVVLLVHCVYSMGLTDFTPNKTGRFTFCAVHYLDGCGKVLYRCKSRIVKWHWQQIVIFWLVPNSIPRIEMASFKKKPSRWPRPSSYMFQAFRDENSSMQPMFWQTSTPRLSMNKALLVVPIYIPKPPFWNLAVMQLCHSRTFLANVLTMFCPKWVRTTGAGPSDFSIGWTRPCGGHGTRLLLQRFLQPAMKTECHPLHLQGTVTSKYWIWTSEAEE